MIDAKIFDPRNVESFKRLFNPYQAQNLLRCKTVVVTVPATALASPIQLKFPKDEFLEAQLIQRIDFQYNYSNSGGELSPNGDVLFYGAHSMYLTIKYKQEAIIEKMPLRFIAQEGENGIFRNFAPFKVDFTDSFIDFTAYDSAVNTTLATTEQKLLFTFWYLPTGVEKDKYDSSQMVTPWEFNPYRDQNVFRLKFMAVPINADPNTTIQRPNLVYDKFLDEVYIQRIVTLDPAALGPVSAGSTGWRKGPGGEDLWFSWLSAYLTLQSDGQNVVENLLLESMVENNLTNGARNLIPFKLDTRKSYFIVSKRDPSASWTGTPHILIGFYYIPKKLVKH